MFIETHGQRASDPENAPLSSYSPLGQPLHHVRLRTRLPNSITYTK